jgi:hypothetical protein
MLVDQAAYDFTGDGQTAEGRFFILAHEAAVAVHVSAENGGELALQICHLGGAIISFDADAVKYAQKIAASAN